MNARIRKGGGEVPSTAKFAVVDVETTGLSSKQDRIIEVAVIRLDADCRYVDHWVQRIQPNRAISPGARAVHGIRDSDLVDQPEFATVAPELARLIGGMLVVAHNASFDTAFLENEFTRAGWTDVELRYLCTLQASRLVAPDLDNHRLATCCEAAGVSLDAAHSALGDARAAALLLQALFRSGVDKEAVLAQVAAPAVRGDAISRQESVSRTKRRTGGHASSEADRIQTRRIRNIVKARDRGSSTVLCARIGNLSANDVFRSKASQAELEYLNNLAAVLQDGYLDQEEASELLLTIERSGLTVAEVTETHAALIRCLADAALEDGRISRDERAELERVADFLNISKDVLDAHLNAAADARTDLLSSAVRALPEDWALGVPLHVGAKVAFTGCDDDVRDRLEQASERAGLQVMNNVSRFTAVLVTDGSVAGTKLRRATELGTRIVTPDEFAALLEYVQARPAAP